ncbi:MAG: hypothetical protein OEZ39_16015 [Gammaproteobacteria bacterium]|nr:hypothetical protein [Gammaproteobacteria bacterium]
MRFPIIWRKLSALSLISGAICYRLLGTVNEISIQWSWPVHFLVVIAAIVALIDFARKRNATDTTVLGDVEERSKARKMLFGFTTFLAALLLLVPAVVLLNMVTPGLLGVSGTTMFYISWLGFSLFTVLYFWFFLPIADRYLDEEFGSKGFV